MEALRFNTAIAKLIELNNHVTRLDATCREVAEPMVLMLAPLVPHMAEELWQRLGHRDTITYAMFPTADPTLLVDDTVEYPVQINGKVRGRVTVSAEADASAVEAATLADPRIIEVLDGATIRKVIVVPGRMVNIVL
jgi:leucyl-tRNA synthetase